MKKLILFLIIAIAFPVGVYAAKPAPKKTDAQIIKELRAQVAALQKELKVCKAPVIKKEATPSFEPLKPFSPPTNVIIPPSVLVEKDVVPPNVSLKFLQARAEMIYKKAKVGQTAPNGGVYGNFSLEVEASDAGSGLARIEYYVDGVFATGLANFINRYPVPWDTNNHSNGEHTLSVKVWDKDGNMGEDFIKIIIKN